MGFTIKIYIRKKHSTQCALKIDQTSRDVVLCAFPNTKKIGTFPDAISYIVNIHNKMYHKVLLAKFKEYIRIIFKGQKIH